MTFQTNLILASKANNAPLVVTWHLCYPRFMHEEVLTHRAASKNSGSSRAIPVKVMVDQVSNHPALPVRFGRNQSGMQDAGDHHELVSVPEPLKAAWIRWTHDTGRSQSYLTTAEDFWRFNAWISGLSAQAYADANYHKQVANRVTQPYQWMNVVFTATDYDNFFELRAHEAADPNFQKVAFAMLAEYRLLRVGDSRVQKLREGEWHLPYLLPEEKGWPLLDQLALSTARCARVSYTPFDGNPSLAKERERHDHLVGSRPRHASPTEHQCTPMLGKWGNFNGWKQYRQFLEEGRGP
jgi:hypothetical protein